MLVRSIIKVLIILTLLLLLTSVVFWLEVLPYRVCKTDRVTQHSKSNFTTYKYSYDVSILGFPLVAETKEQILCNKFDAYGKIKVINLGDGTGDLKKNYAGVHIIVDRFICK